MSPRHILDRIVETKEREVEGLLPRRRDFEARSADAPSPRRFAEALDPSRVGVIAEVKRRSPGAGPIREGLDPVALAAEYERYGARAVSVLTDREYFGGSIEDLVAVRARVEIPLLRKDFTIDEVQILEARAAGADLILLIVRILDDARLKGFRELAESLGMTALVEVHDEEELDRAEASGAEVIGVNNRDLSTFHTELAVTERMLDRLPADRIVVSESGIRTGDDVARLGRAGVDAVLVGESILRADRPGDKLAELAAHTRHTDR